MDQEQTQFLRHWLDSRFIEPMFGVGEKGEPGTLGQLPGAGDCTLFGTVFNLIVSEDDPKSTFGGPKLQLMHRLKTLLRAYHLDASDFLASIFRRLDSESGKVDLLSLLHFLCFLTTTEFEHKITPFDCFASNLYLHKTLQLALSIYLRVLGQMQGYAKVSYGDSPFQPSHCHKRSENSVLKRQRLDLEAEIEQLRVTNNQLQMQLLAVTTRETHSEATVLRQESVAKRLELQFESERVEERAKEMEEKDAMIVKCQREIAKLRNEKARLSDDLDVAKEKLTDMLPLERKLQAWKDKIDSFDSLKSELCDVKATLQVCLQDKANLAERLHESQMYAAKADYLVKEMQKMEGKYLSALRESGELRIQLEDAQAQAASRPVITRISVREETSDIGEIEELHSKLFLAEIEITNLKTMLEAQKDDELRRKVSETEAEAEFLRNSKEDWLHKYAILENKIRAADVRFEAERNNLQRIVESAEGENRSLKGKVASLVTEVNQLKAEVTKSWKVVQEERQMGMNYKLFSEDLSREVSDMKAKEVSWVAHEWSQSKHSSHLEKELLLYQSLLTELESHVTALLPCAPATLYSSLESLLRCTQARPSLSEHSTEDSLHTSIRH